MFYSPSLLNKINEMEEEFEKPAKGRPMKGGKSGNDSKGLTRGRIKKVNEFMIDLKGVMVSSDSRRYLKWNFPLNTQRCASFIIIGGYIRTGQG